MPDEPPLPYRRGMNDAATTRPAQRPGRRERLLVVGSLGVVAMHVVTDAFVALEPGTTRREHVVSALVPLALLAAAAIVHARARPGVRAGILLPLGALTLVGGGIALAQAVSQGPSGDDWTGLPLLAAGAALVAVGAWTLWRSRHRRGRWLLRRSLVALGAVVVAYALVVPVAVALVATHRPREAVAATTLSPRGHVPVTLETSDGLRLRGWYVPSTNGAAILAFPGRRSPIPHARLLARHGYGVLLLDMRGQGESEGDPNAFGWGARPDVDAAVRFLQSRPDVDDDRIGGLGLSVGGELLIEAAATNAALRAVVSEGAGERSVRESRLRGAAGLPSLPLAAMLTAATAIFSGDPPPPSVQSVVARIAPRPLLLVYAGRGGGGEELNPDYFDAAEKPKALWEIPEAGHVGGLEARPAEYERRVVGFFDRALARD